jgi:hypothetical protein
MSDPIKAHVSEYKVTKKVVVVEIPAYMAREMLDGKRSINAYELELASAIELALVEFEEQERPKDDDINF